VAVEGSVGTQVWSIGRIPKYSRTQAENIGAKKTGKNQSKESRIKPKMRANNNNQFDVAVNCPLKISMYRGVC